MNKKNLVSFFLFLILMAAYGKSLTVNYHRYDGNYDEWNLWIWLENGEGKSYNFTEKTDYGVKTIINFPEEVERIGFIVRKGEWVEKDVDEDRYIDLTKSNREIWLLSSDREIYSRRNDVDTSDRIISGFIESSNTIRLVLTSEIETSSSKKNFTLKNSSGNFIEIKNVTPWNSKTISTEYVINGKEITFVFSPEKYGLKADKNTKVSMASSINGWKENDKNWEFKYINDKNVFELTRKIGISKDMVSENTEFKFVVNHGKNTNWYPQGDNIIVSTKNHSKKDRIIKLETLAKLNPYEKYTVKHESFGQITPISYNILEEYSHEGWLGNRYSKEQTVFKLWSPVSTKAYVRIFDNDSTEKFREYEMKLNGNVFEATIKENLKNKFYIYRMEMYGETKFAQDPYAYSSGVNGKRSAVVDLKSTDPQNFRKYSKPEFSGKNTDAVIYEIHVRDYSTDEKVNFEWRGQFKGLTEKNRFLKNYPDIKTGIDHIKELGVTHVHILPVMDFASVDENRGGFNWGYDPYSYFSLEGSYSSNPSNPEVRIREFKEMIKSFHENGLRVVLDVVYNHTYSSMECPLARTVPYYYYRLTEDGKFSNGSGCGNETASEKNMMRKHIVESLEFFADEYRVDGFRFDLMALHDIETMKIIEKKLKQKHPDIIIYGEPWAAASSMLKHEEMFFKGAQKNTTIGVFNDNLRNSIKGDSDGYGKGFATGDLKEKENIIKGIVGSIDDFAEKACETVNYVSAHDNLTLFDKIDKLHTNNSMKNKAKMSILANALVIFSQGMPFIHGGAEILRSKGGNHNSYNAGDEVNKILWQTKVENFRVFEYYRNMIELRKKYDCFRMSDRNEITANIKIHHTPDGVIAVEYLKSGLLAIFNADKNGITLRFPGTWSVILPQYGEEKNSGKVLKDYVSINPLSVLILKKEI
ncbi:MAG: type I pullulanase [Candidatus Muiribacteriota bacterium]